MSAFGVLFARELRGFLVSPWSYLASALFLLAAGLAAFPPTALAEGVVADASDYTGLWPWFLCPLGAALGARLWARERRAGSIVLLLSQPTPLWLIALAKFAAAWLLVVGSLALLAPVWLAAAMVVPLDVGALLGAYLGGALLGGVYVAIGAAASALAVEEPTALALAVAAGALVTAPAQPPLGAPAWLASLADWSPAAAFAQARFGVVQLADMFLMLAAIGLFLGFSIIAVVLRRVG
jgi:ABC-2 type transport system permease protein